MAIRKLLLTASAVSLAAAPIAAAATDLAYATQPLAGESDVGSMETRFIIGGILAAGLAIWIIADDDDDDDDEPISP